jgi:hypothetical protein
MLTPYGHGARRDVGRIDFAGLVREIASAASTEAGVMLGFAQVFALFSRLFFGVQPRVAGGSHGLRWRLSGLLEDLQTLEAKLARRKILHEDPTRRQRLF